MPEYKQLSHATKAIDGRTVVGIVAVHGNIDEGGDKSWPGSFADPTVDGRDRAVFLWMHDPSMPPTAAINYVKEVRAAGLPDSVKAYAPDATGGVEISRTYLDTPRGNEILAGLQAGAIHEMSYAYTPLQYDFEELDGRTIRNLRKVEIFDYSDVAWGMNPATVGSKAAWKDRPLTDHAAELESAIRDFAERLAELKERRAKAGRTFSAANTTRIGGIADDLAKAAADLKTMLHDSEPKQTIDGQQLLIEYERTLARLSGVRL
jgi:phage head maturation protease